jgi:hypothetical protein
VRPIATWFLVGAVAALGLTASVDALRGGKEVVRARAPEASSVPGLVEQPDEAVSQLREIGVRGVLTYSDGDCRLHAVSLPALEPAEAPPFEMCQPVTSSGGIGAFDGQVIWSGLGYGTVQVVLSRRELSRAVRDALGIRDEVQAGFRAVQAVALGGRRYLVLAESTYGPRDRVLAAALQGERPLFVQAMPGVEDVRAIRPSPRGEYFAVLGRSLRLYGQDGAVLDMPGGVSDASTVAWSPDDRWTALATSRSVYIYESERPEGRVVRVPLEVRDLDWTGGPTLASLPELLGAPQPTTRFRA